MTTVTKKKHKMDYSDVFNLSYLFKDMSLKGSQCSVKGNEAERKVWEICKELNICTVDINQLGGSSADIDIPCNFNGITFGIETKSKLTAPDWTQLSITPDDNFIWRSKGNNKIPEKSKILIENLLKDAAIKINIFNGKIPPFIERPMKHSEWLEIKRLTDDYNDIYINCPNNFISECYKHKGCHYIQLCDGHGLYHTGEDICNFNVPYFQIESRLRIRIKIHSTENSHGYMSASVMASLQPVIKNTKILTPSPYSLSEKERIPPNLLRSV